MNSPPTQRVALPCAKINDDVGACRVSHRLVACHLERCIECYAVPDCPEDENEDLDGPHKAKVHYVLAVPMLFRSKDGMGCEKNYMLACDCPKMRHVWEILQCGWQSTMSTYEEWCEKAPLCEHAEQLLYHDSAYFSDCLWDLNGLQICRSLDDVTLPEPAGPISLIGNTPLGLLVSVSLNRNNFPRNTVLCTNSRIFECLDCRGPNRFSCQHCKFFANWLAKDCNDPPLKQRLSGWTLREDVHNRFGRMRSLATPPWQNMICPLGPGHVSFTPRSLPLVKKLPEGSVYPGAPCEGYGQEVKATGGSTGGEANVMGRNFGLPGNIDENGVGTLKKSESSSMEKVETHFKTDSSAVGRMEVGDTPAGSKKTKRQEQKKILPNVLEKRCSKCGVVKPASGFYRDSKDDTGLQHWCRACCLRHGPRSNQRSVKRCQLRSFGYLQSPQMMMMAKQSQYPSKTASPPSHSDAAPTPLSKPQDRSGLSGSQLEDSHKGSTLPMTSPGNALESLEALPLSHVDPSRPVQILRSEPYSRLRPTPILSDHDLEQFRLHEPIVSDSRFPITRACSWAYGMQQQQQTLEVVEATNGNPFSAATGVNPSVASALVDLNGNRVLQQSSLGDYGAGSVRARLGSTAMARDNEVFDFQGVGGGIEQEPQIFDAAEAPMDLTMLSFGLHNGGDLSTEFRNGLNAGVIGSAVDGRLHYTSLSTETPSDIREVVAQQHAAVDLMKYQGISCGSTQLAPSIPQQATSQAINISSAGIEAGKVSFPFDSTQSQALVMDVPWIDQPDGDSVDSQGSGERDWSVIADTLPNGTGDVNGLKIVSGDVSTLGLSSHMALTGNSFMQPLSRKQHQNVQRIAGLPADGNPIRLVVQKPTGSRKRKPKIIKRVPPGNGSPGSDVEVETVTTKRLNVEPSSQGQLKIRRTMLKGQGMSDLDFGVGSPLDCKVEMDQLACCPGCHEHRTAMEFSSSGLCTMCTLSQPFMKVCTSCGQVRYHRKPHRLKDPCIDCEREKCLIDPGQVVSPSSFLPSELPGDDGDLNGSSDDPLNDDAHFMTMDFLRNENEHLLVGQRTEQPSRHLPSPLGM